MRERFSVIKRNIIEFFKQDIVLKILSVFLAFIIWFVVLSNNNEYKDDTRKFGYTIMSQELIKKVKQSDGSVKEFRNAEDVKIDVDLKISGRERSRNNVSDDNFKVEIKEQDLPEMNRSGVYNVYFDITTSKLGISVKNKGDNYVAVKFEEIVERNFEVKVDVAKDVIAPGLDFVSSLAQPHIIKARGFESKINQIQRAEVKIDSSMSVEKITNVKNFINANCVFYDAENQRIEGIEAAPVDVTVQVGKKVKLDYQMIGVPADGSYIKNTTYSDVDVVVVGPADKLAEITSLKTKLINIDDITKTTQFQVELEPLPEGVRLADESKKIYVTVELGGYVNKSIKVDIDKIKLLNGSKDFVYECVSISDSVLEVNGKEENVEHLSVEDIDPKVNVQGLGVGTHERRRVQFSLPSGVTYVTSVYVDIEIREKNVSTPTPSPSGAPSGAPEQTSTPGQEDVD